MTKKIILITYILISYFVSIFIVSEFVSFIGIPNHINETVKLHNNQTFHHLFLVTSIQNHSGILYTVNNSQQYALSPNETVQLSSGSDFSGTIHVENFMKNSVVLKFHIQRENLINIVIYMISIFLVIPFYALYSKIMHKYTQNKDQHTP